MSITEYIVELVALETLQELGWSCFHGSAIAPDSIAPERRSFGDVILVGRLEAAVARIKTVCGTSCSGASLPSWPHGPECLHPAPARGACPRRTAKPSAR
ncbi:MAG TPA: hypothetical protein VNS79_13190 [Sphingobium sp.]|nr:hypothetical protein [Sphingobium sp.]